MDVINEANAKDLLLYVKREEVSFLFEAAFKFVCNHFVEIIVMEPEFSEDIRKEDGELWREIGQVVLQSEGRTGRSSR